MAHPSLNIAKLEKARTANPDGYGRLANFVLARTLDPLDVLLATERHRALQVLATRRGRPRELGWRE